MWISWLLLLCRLRHAEPLVSQTQSSAVYSPNAHTLRDRPSRAAVTWLNPTTLRCFRRCSPSVLGFSGGVARLSASLCGDSDSHDGEPGHSGKSGGLERVRSWSGIGSRLQRYKNIRIFNAGAMRLPQLRDAVFHLL